MALIESLPPTVGLVLLVLIIIWMILAYCIPIYIYGTWYRASECSRHPARTNELLEQIARQSRNDN